MSKNIFLIFALFFLMLSLTGCGETKSLDYNIDKEIEKVINIEPFQEDLLNEELQESLKEESTNEDLAIVDTSLIGYEGAKNELPISAMFDRKPESYNEKIYDWLGEKWTLTAFENKNNDEITGIRLLLGFSVNDMEYAHRRIRELTNNFLKLYNNIVYSSNIYEYKLENTYDAPIEFIASIDKSFISYKVLMYDTGNGTSFPCIQIFFVAKEPLHDVSDNDLAYEINHLRNVIDKKDEEVLLRTIKLSPTMGYIIDEPKSKEDMTPEEELISSGVFYK